MPLLCQHCSLTVCAQLQRARLLSVFCGGFRLCTFADLTFSRVCAAQYTGPKLRIHQLGCAMRPPCCTSLYQSCTSCLTCCRCCQQVPNLAVAWQGRTVATAAALPLELTAAFLRAGAEAVMCARESGQDAAAQAVFIRSFYSGVLSGRLSIVDALSEAGEACPADVCQSVELPQHGLRHPGQLSHTPLTSARACCLLSHCL